MSEVRASSAMTALRNALIAVAEGLPVSASLKEETITGWLVAMLASAGVPPMSLVREAIVHLDWRRDDWGADARSALRVLPWLSPPSRRPDAVTRFDNGHQQILHRLDLAVLSGAVDRESSGSTRLELLRPVPHVLVELKALASQGSLTQAQLRDDICKLGLAREVMRLSGRAEPECALVVVALADGAPRSKGQKSGRTPQDVRGWLSRLAGPSGAGGVPAGIDVLLAAPGTEGPELVAWRTQG